MVVFEDGKPRTGEYRRFRVRRPGPERLREPPGGAPPPVPPRPDGRGGECRGAPLAVAGPRDHRRRKRPGAAPRSRSWTSSASPTCRWPAWRRSAKSCSCRGAPSRSSCPDVAGALPRPAAPRRGAPVRDHVPPRPARQGDGAFRVRRPARRRARNAGARCSVSSARRSASARRRSSRSPRSRESGRRWRRRSKRR